MYIVISLSQAVLGGGLSMVFGGGLLLIVLARLSHNTGDDCSVAGWIGCIGQLAFILVAIVVLTLVLTGF